MQARAYRGMQAGSTAELPPRVGGSLQRLLSPLLTVKQLGGIASSARIAHQHQWVCAQRLSMLDWSFLRVPSLPKHGFKLAQK
mmetsp:Transcript_17817/g.23992  ORF Transcript_17817/g.23992 Transcript_17817/m.23992 type:complete len:83 (+) Transcript_17817:276-524(+)